MARQPISPPGQRVLTQYHDAAGNLVLETEYNERIIVAPDGSLTHQKLADNIALTSGEMFHPGLATGPNPVLVPGLCTFCRPHRNGARPLTNAKHLQLCVRCGQACCPQHRIQSRYDRKWRCRHCHLRHRIALFLRFVVCERVEG